MNTQIEIRCDSYYDARQAEIGGTERTELNSTLYMSGLILSVATLRLIEEHTKLSIMTMIRLHGAGFHYLLRDYSVTVGEARDMVRNDAGETTFGYLDAYGNIDTEQSGHITALARVNHGQVVFHRAFGCVKNPFKAIETLINMGADRVLTSGICPMVFEGKEVIRQLQERYGDRIGILAGYGIDATNAKELTVYTGVRQIHSSCKDWLWDEAICGERVTYSYGPQGHKSDYEVVNSKEVEHLIWNARWPPTE